MDDPGYADYQDARLIPPDINEPDEMTPAECWERCVHAVACMGLLLRLSDVRATSVEHAAEAMGCAECDEWAE
jgi:hypothetical protein